MKSSREKLLKPSRAFLKLIKSFPVATSLLKTLIELLNLVRNVQSSYA